MVQMTHLRPATEVQGIHALIGRDVLQDCILILNGTVGELTLAF